MASWESLHKRAERIVASRKKIEEQKLQFIDAELYTMNEIYASVIGDKDCQDFRSFLLACDESQRAVLHMDDGTLIIMDEWIRLPTLFMSRIMDRESPLKVGGAGDFTGDEYHSLYQHGGTYLLNDLNIFAQQV